MSTAASLPDGAVILVHEHGEPAGRVWQKYAPPDLNPRYWHWSGLGMIDDPYPDSYVQAEMDRHGYHVLWPREEPPV